MNEDRRMMSSRREVSGGRIKQLEEQIHRIRESESKTLETLIQQTRLLAETKIELDKARLQITVLQDTVRSCRNINPNEKLKLEKMEKEVKLANCAEEKSKKAMDHLAIALKEVVLDANQTKEKLTVVEAQLREKRLEAENSEEMVERLKMEATESGNMWNIKHQGLKDCFTLLEDENNKLIQAQKSSKDEISNMRDTMKQALNEAKMAKEALEIARNQNSTLIQNTDIITDEIKSNGHGGISTWYRPPSFSLRKWNNVMSSFDSSSSSTLQQTTIVPTGEESKILSLPSSSSEPPNGDDEHERNLAKNTTDPSANEQAQRKKKRMFRKFTNVMKITAISK